jgi:phytanoyl-CoA hydroxylase
MLNSTCDLQLNQHLLGTNLNLRLKTNVTFCRYYFMIEPNSAAVTMWLALDPADERNGCLVYVKESGLKPMRPHEVSGVLGFSQRCSDYGTPEDLANELALPASPGGWLTHAS